MPLLSAPQDDRMTFCLRWTVREQEPTQRRHREEALHLHIRENNKKPTFQQLGRLNAVARSKIINMRLSGDCHTTQ